MSDRILGVLLLALAGLYGWEASRWEVPFSYDPLGPNAFPQLLAGLLALLAVSIVIKRAETPEWPRGALLRRIGLMAVCLVIYAILLFQIGFVISTILAGMALARLVDANWRQSLATGLGMSAIFYLVFVQMLHVDLPDGHLIHALLRT
jgi:putative tricarboxylic transport membrane protein